jgi:organic radical activating enzyme
MLNKIVKSYLDSVGPGFCLAKWTDSTMHLGIGKNHSCHHPYPHQIPLHELKENPAALHNSSYKKTVRKEMLEGQRPEECNYCWKIEDSGQPNSDRVLMSKKKDVVVFYKKIKNSSYQDNWNPTYLEVSFSNICNFACAYCGPQYSSKWLGEINARGPYTDSGNYNFADKKIILDHSNNPYIDAFWEYLPTIYKNLRILRITGGEPTLSKHTDKLLDFISKNPNKKMSLVINSNLGISRPLLEEFVGKLQSVRNNLKKIEISTSGESHSTKAEYVRDGVDYYQWLDNCRYVLDTIPNLRLNLMCTYNIFSITSFTLFLKDIRDIKENYKNVTVSVSCLRDPHFMSIANAPREWESYLNESLEFIKSNFSKETYDRFNHVISFFNSSSPDAVELMYLGNFIKEYDQRRKKEFLKVFPEYDFIFRL